MLTIIGEKDQNRLLQRAGVHLCQTIRGVLARREQVNLAVPGGRSVVKIFQAMQGEEVAWPRVHFFIIDERLVPVDHPDSNYRLLRENFIDPLVQADKIPPGNAHPFLFDPTCEDRGAAAYEQVLGTHGSRFDIILLSAGEDGHVGALYPHHHSLENDHHGIIVMDDSPKPPPARMTASRSLMQTAAAAVLLFVGEAKREAFAKFGDAGCPVAACPAKLVLALPEATVFTDLN